MPSTFFGIEIGARGLSAAQVGQDTVGHNIANANTPGYSAQSVNQLTSDPLAAQAGYNGIVSGQIGTGVSAASITRARDQFLDTQARGGLSDQGLNGSQNTALTQLEQALNEPSDNGINHALGVFFQNFNQLANSPEDQGVRATVIQGGQALANVFHTVQGSLDTQSQSLTSKVSADIKSLNDYATQIAALNVSIRQATAQNQTPNDLLDRRDLLIDKVASLANISVVPKTDGTVSISVGSSHLVIGTDAYSVTLNGLNAQGDLKSGELAGLAKSQTELASTQSHLDTLAGALTTQVNNAHQQGVGLDGSTGLAFFTGTDARTIGINQTLDADPSKLAAGASAAPGDATVAAQLAGLESQTLPTGPLAGTSLTGFYQNSVTSVGSAAAAAKSAAATSTLNAAQLTQQRDAVSGVSTDNETINLLKYQRAYEASARVVKTMDQMLGDLLNGLFAN